MSYKTGFYEGRLGIGLDSTMGMGDGNPRYPLDINGDIRLTGSIVNGDGQVLSLTPAAVNWTIDDDDIFFTAGGNVGIGTTSPGSTLEIKDVTSGTAGEVESILKVNSVSGYHMVSLGTAGPTTYHSGSISIYKTTNATGTIKSVHLSGSTDDTYFNGGGNVGIGTTSPGSLLQVGTDDSSIVSDGTIRIAKSSGTSSRRWGHLGYDSGYNFGWGDQSSTDKQFKIAYGAPANSLVVKYDGNVGIGTTSPDHKLHIDGGNTGSTTFNDVVLKLSGTSTKNNGSVGMLFNMREGASGAKSAIFSKDYAGTWNRSSLVFCTNNDTNSNDATLSDAKMVIRETGNVGIGTTSPDANLDVHSSGRTITNSSYKTKTWAQMKTEIESQGGSMPTRDQILSLQSSILQSGQDKWAAGVTRLGGWQGSHNQWYEIGNLNHVYGREHPGYPSWGDTTTSYDFRDTAAIISKPLKINHGFFINHYEYSAAWGQAVFQMVSGSKNYCTMGFSRGTDSGSHDNILEAITFSRHGRVGINKSLDMAARLHVQGNVGGSSFTGFRYTSSGTASSNNTTNIALYVYGEACVYGTLRVGSDRRIKENIVDVPDNLALEMVRKIPCRYYEYRNKINVGSGKTIGFIAQEVKEHFPMAVNTTQKEFLPTKMCELENISWNEIIDASSNFGIGFQLISDLEDVSGQKYKFFVANDLINEAVEKEIIVDSLNRFIFQEKWEYVFCYGKEVDDFHTLDKQKLFALNFSATQELDRKVIALENENAELKAELAAIKQHLGI